MTRAAWRRRLAGLGVALALAGCAKQDESPKPAPAADRPPPIAEATRTRDREACAVYVEAVCACAKAKPDNAELAERCRYDQALPDALRMSLATADHEASSRNDVLIAQKQYLKIATNCLESTAKLAAMGCTP